MAQSTELGKTQIVTKDGVLTATVVDRVSPDRVAMMLFRGSVNSIYAGVDDETAVVSRELKDLLVFPFNRLA